MIKELFLKLKYIVIHRYNPYPLYWFDLLTERHIRNRIGKCIDCIECCAYVSENENDIIEYCEHVCHKTKRCKIYNKRKCDKWFPISEKELKYMISIKPNMTCKFSFSNEK
jgi:hypothetical protein